jgi:hypothetical protein
MAFTVSVSLLLTATMTLPPLAKLTGYLGVQGDQVELATALIGLDGPPLPVARVVTAAVWLARFFETIAWPQRSIRHPSRKRADLRVRPAGGRLDGH